MKLSTDDQPILGSRAIAEAVGLSHRQTLWLIESGALPVRRLGRRVYTTPRWLREDLATRPADRAAA
jgi:hypothetical protein